MEVEDEHIREAGPQDVVLNERYEALIYREGEYKGFRVVGDCA